MRALVPRRLYPGSARVGASVTRFSYPPDVPVFDGIDWFIVPSLFRAIAFLRRQAPQVLLLEWWTATTLLSYLALALAALRSGIPVVIELHEIQDVGEARSVAARAYSGVGIRLLLRLARASIVHSDYDRAALGRALGIRSEEIAVIPHGRYDQYGSQRRNDAPDGPYRLLFFGVLRPYKGVDDLLDAFELLTEAEAAEFRLTIVGEKWEAGDDVERRIARSPRRDSIEFVPRYVTDDELRNQLARTDAVVLPYRRASASGPLHVAMALGLPVVVSEVGGLAEAVAGYAGAVLVPPQDPPRLADALRAIRSVPRGGPGGVPWPAVVQLFDRVFAGFGRRA